MFASEFFVPYMGGVRAEGLARKGGRRPVRRISGPSNGVGRGTKWPSRDPLGPRRRGRVKTRLSEWLLPRTPRKTLSTTRSRKQRSDSQRKPKGSQKTPWRRRPKTQGPRGVPSEEKHGAKNRAPPRRVATGCVGRTGPTRVTPSRSLAGRSSSRYSTRTYRGSAWTGATGTAS